jgi:hypothetical protein
MLLQKLDEDMPGELEVMEGSERASPEHLFRLGTRVLAAGGEDPLTALPFYLGTVEAPQLRSD